MEIAVRAVELLELLLAIVIHANQCHALLVAILFPYVKTIAVRTCTFCFPTTTHTSHRLLLVRGIHVCVH